MKGMDCIDDFIEKTFFTLAPLALIITLGCEFYRVII